MQNVALQKVRNMDAAARAVVQRWLGRPLSEQEEIAVVALDPGVDALQSVLDRMAEQASRVPRSELNTLMEEAIDHVRHN